MKITKEDAEAWYRGDQDAKASAHQAAVFYRSELAERDVELIAVKAQRDAAIASLNETFFDPDFGPSVWRRPTAEAYARVCTLYHKAHGELAEIFRNRP